MKIGRDLSGERFGRLVAMRTEMVNEKGRRRKKWQCDCDCGENTIVAAAHLTSGRTVSCGCFHKEAITKHGEAPQPKLGKLSTKEWRCWTYMRSRCNDPGNKKYKDYGGRGITVAPQWSAYERFLEDVGRAPSREHSLDRIDVNGNYEPGNVCWSTKVHQSLNRRNSTQASVNRTSGLLGFGC